ncbi:hypothetical protein GIY62_28770 [Burkholderia plantarii]|nr:hypothetical protein GIY62_28770 [Burkholderia plantarii]
MEPERTVTTDSYRGHVIAVTAHRNERGAWVPSVTLTREGAPVGRPLPEPVDPEWLTEEEAVRAGIERGRFAVDREQAQQ